MFKTQKKGNKIVKKLLITGKDSYIGTHVKQWLEKEQDNYEVDELDVKDTNWRNVKFQGYDTILHVAGIAHVSSDPNLEDLYYKVNRDLAIEVAKKAKQDGVKQLIFMSSMIIYGKDEPIGNEKVINADTQPSATDFYGKSKLEADKEIRKLSCNDFKTAIIRTPMVYGPNCKGNFPKLKRLAKLVPLFPDIENKRSMIYIDNLCQFIKNLIDKQENGIFYPQNREYISTKQIINIMAKTMNKKMHFIKLFNPIIKLLSRKVGTINKVFGNKVYSKKISGDFDYIVVENDESIRRSV